MRLVHVFRNIADVERQLPYSPPANRPGWEKEVVGSFSGRGVAPGGYGAGSGIISKREFDAFPAIYVKGTLWLAYDLDDSRNVPTLTEPTWVGTLGDPVVNAGEVTLPADGLAGKAEREFDARLWEDRGTQSWAVGDVDPYNLDTDEQIELRIDEDELKWRVKHGAQFKRAHGRTALKEKAEIGDTSITVRNNWGGLSDGEAITIGGEAAVVANSYDEDETTIPLTAPLAANHDAGAIVTWTAPDTPAAWSTPAVYADPGEQINEIEFAPIDLDHPASEYSLRIHRFTYPDVKARVLVDTIQLNGTLDNRQTVAIPGASDGITLELRRTSETKKARGFKCKVKARVRGRATSSSYRTDEVATDVATMLGGGDLTGIAAGGMAAMPLHTRSESAAQILDYCCSLDDRVWLRLHDGTQSVWIYDEWGSQNTWTVVEPRFPRALRSIRRFSHVRINYRHEGGVEFHTKVAAVPAVGFTDVMPLDIPDPPTFDTALAFGAAVANYVSLQREWGECTFSEVEDSLGNVWPASVVKPGDLLELPGRTLRVEDINYQQDQATASFPQGYPQVDRWLNVRNLLAARGRSNKMATLVGLGLAEPAEPLDPVMTFEKQDTRGLDYKAKIVWTHNEFTIDGDPTVLRNHYVRLRRCTEEGVALDEKVMKKRIPVKEDSDDVAGDGSDRDDRCFFDRIDEPGSWYQFRIAAEGLTPRGKRGPWGPGPNAGGWSDPQQVPDVRGAREVATFTSPGTLSVNDAKPKYEIDSDMEVKRIVANIDTSPTGQAVIIQVKRKRAGVTESFFDTADRLTIAPGESRDVKHQDDMTSPGGEGIWKLEDGDKLSIDIQQVGNGGEPGKDLVVQIIMRGKDWS